ncbi:hypothetical protein M5689_008349 [Euphorbia peplus]|nr:hypothetical protein M5689_008349 [Euphorbia peplus]
MSDLMQTEEDRVQDAGYMTSYADIEKHFKEGKHMDPPKYALVLHHHDETYTSSLVVSNSSLRVFRVPNLKLLSSISFPRSSL